MYQDGSVSDQPSTKPYLIRAIYEWCADNGYRPYIAVAVDETTVVPMEFVRGGEIVLNVSTEATHHLVIGNQRIEFEARFNRVARQVSVPVANVTAIYAAENGHGMAFEVPKPLGQPRASRGGSPVLSAAAPEPDAPGSELALPPAVEGAAPGDASAPVSDQAAAGSESPATVQPAPRRRGRTRKAEAPASPMALVPLPSASPSAEAASPGAGPDEPRGPVPPAGGRPRLTRVK